jgi:DNA mismatch repair protein MutL
VSPEKGGIAQMKSVSKIHILSESLMKRIAAGEVVERPASVVKELIENSLDAEATSVMLQIRGHGLELIQVTDNGEGMTEEDLQFCSKRHATSKITSVEDLENIQSFGFRGEALASIGSVSKLTIISRTKQEETASQITVEEGQIQEMGKKAFSSGTTVMVRNLFTNVPARRKFMKSPATEIKQVIGVFKRMALSHPHVDFSLYINDEKTMDFRKTEMENRVREVFGREKFGLMLPVSRSYGSLEIDGYICRPGEFRRTREDQLFFLNNRYIQNRSLMHAVISAYGPRLDHREFPFFLIFIRQDAKFHDVNVHPTKIEVRFADEKYVHDAVHRAVQEALRTRQSVPEFYLVRRNIDRTNPSNRPDSGNSEQLSLQAQMPDSLTGQDPGSSRIRPEPAQFWQVHNRYILSQIKSGLTMIDQHAAHERILYEKALWARHLSGSASQQLLFPHTLQLAADDLIILSEIVSHLEKIGFSIRQFGGNTIIIDSVPVELKSGEANVVIEILEEYKENRSRATDIWEAVAASYACKAAIKSGDPLTQQEMANLVDQLFASKDPYFCPHGRPIVVNLTLAEIDKRFGR